MAYVALGAVVILLASLLDIVLVGRDGNGDRELRRRRRRKRERRVG